MLQRRTALAIALAMIFIVTDIGVGITSDYSSASTGSSDIVSDPDQVRLQIYGNANGDDYIDEKDIDILNSIISNNVTDWSSTYPFADANQDGVIDSQDVDVVRKIINGDSVRMYYLNRYDYLSFVNYPISSSIMCSNMTYPLLYVTGTFDKLMAIDQSAKNYMGEYEGWDKYILIPNLAQEHTLESLTSAISQGVGTFIQWTGGQGSNYLWEMSGIDEVASEMSIVTVHIMGPNCIKGALMFAEMLGDIHLADDYKAWYDDALDRFSVIGNTVEKKTVSVIQCFGSAEFGTYRFYGSNQPPAYWFNVVLDFQDGCKGKSGMTVANSFEEFVTMATDEIVVMSRRDGATREDYASVIQERLQRIYGQSEQYEDGKIYVIDWDAMPYFNGPAGCYILAAYLYPGQFKMDDALDFLQTYLDKFEPGNANARVGFTYPMIQSSSDDDDNPSDKPIVTPDDNSNDSDNSDNTMIYVVLAVIVVAIVAAIAVYVHKRNS